MVDDTGGAPDAPVVRLYTKRWWWIPAAFFGSLFVLVGAAALIGDVRNHGHDTLWAFMAVVIGIVPMLLGLYYLITPIPLLLMDQLGISYQTFPLIIEGVRWEDIAAIRAFKYRYSIVRPNLRAARLVLNLDIRKAVAAAYGNRPSLTWTFAGADLPITPERMVEQIRRFHSVKYEDQYAAASAAPVRHTSIARGPSTRHATRSTKHGR